MGAVACMQRALGACMQPMQRRGRMHAAYLAAGCSLFFVNMFLTQGQKGLFNSHLTPLADGFDCGVILGMKVQVSVK